MNNLQIMRKSAGLTQAALATRSGVNIRTLQHYELISNEDLANRRTTDILKLCNAIGCTMSDLFKSQDAFDYDQALLKNNG